MNYIGIDPAADSFTFTRYIPASKLVGNSSTFDSHADGIAQFLASLEQQGCTPEETVICIENTGVYSELLCYTLHQAGFQILLIEPIKIHRALGQGTAKTDPLDSLKIAEYAYRFRDKLKLWEPHEAIIEQIRVLLSTREQLVKQQTALSNSRQALQRKYIQTPAANASLDVMIQQAKEQIKQLEQEIKRLIKQHPTMANIVNLIVSAPGVGILLAAHLLVISEGFSQPITYRQMAAQLGIAPLEHTSGTSVKRKPRSRGYGPRTMRKLLHLAARSVVTHKRTYKLYYHRKLAEGKPKKLVLNNVSNQLLRVLCSMLKNNKPYMDGYVSVYPRLLVS